MKKVYLILFAAFALSISQTAAAQENPPPRVTQPIRGGVVNGKASLLVKPAYPPAARAVRASGAVNVQVTIDENGDVISAAAVSGHPLLRAAAVEAARQSKFSPTMLSGQPVKVTGVIVYNFVSDDPEPMFWFAVGTMVGALRTVESDDEGDRIVAQMAADLPAAFAAEKAKLIALPSDAAAKREIIAEVFAALETKLGGAERTEFEIGATVTEIMIQVRDRKTKKNITPNAATLRASLSKLSSLIAVAPPNFPANSRAALDKLAAFADRDNLSDPATVDEITDAIQDFGVTISPGIPKGN